jgi:hypothetical protein
MTDVDDEQGHRRLHSLSSLLSQYYGRTQEGSDSPTTIATDVNNIDSARFDANKYVKKLLENQPLDELMKRDQKLSKEIKKLDTDLQMLVYENYNKFITATDTIKKMKVHVESMEGEMKNLAINMENITNCSSTINNNLAPRRSQIEKLSSVNRMLKKMQFLLELPSRLNQCLEMKTYAVAVKYYNIADNILKQYSHLPSFQSIQEESMVVMTKIKTALREILNDPTATHNNLEEYLKLLLDLKEPVDEVLKDFLDGRRSILNSMLKEYDNSKSITQNLKDLNQQFITSFLSNVRIYHTLFKKTQPLVEFTRDLFNNYFKISRKILVEGYQHIAKEGVQDTGMQDLKSAVLMFAVDLYVVHAKVPDAALSDKISNVLSDAIRHYILSNVKIIKSKIHTLISALAKHKPKEPVTLDLINNTAEEIMQIFKTFIAHYKNFIEMRDSKFIEPKLPVFQSWIKSHCVGLFDHITEVLNNSVAPHSILTVTRERHNDTTTTGALLLCRLAMTLASETVPQVQKLLNDGGKNYFIGEQLSSSLERTSQVLIVHYIEQSGMNCSKFIRAGMETSDWINTDVPRDVRTHITVLADETIKIYAELIAILPNTMTRSHSTDSLRSATTIDTTTSPFLVDSFTFGNNDANSIVKDVMKIFNKKLATFRIKTPREITVRVIMTEVLKLTCKSLEEFVRACTFGKNGYQQIQVDTTFLRMLWSSQCGVDESFIGGLLNEVMASSAERSLEPTPLEKNVVNTLIEKKLEKRK